MRAISGLPCSDEDNEKETVMADAGLLDQLTLALTWHYYLIPVLIALIVFLVIYRRRQQ